VLILNSAVGTISLRLPIVLITNGFIVVIISFLGCCGVIRESVRITMSYAVCLLILIILQLTIVVLLFTHKDKIIMAMGDDIDKAWESFKFKIADAKKVIKGDVSDAIQTEIIKEGVFDAIQTKVIMSLTNLFAIFYHWICILFSLNAVGYLYHSTIITVIFSKAISQQAVVKTAATV